MRGRGRQLAGGRLVNTIMGTEHGGRLSGPWRGDGLNNFSSGDVTNGQKSRLLWAFHKTQLSDTRFTT
jgi:hypothetical protein